MMARLLICGHRFDLGGFEKLTYVEQSDRDRFFIIAADQRMVSRESLFERIREHFGHVEIFAPIEKRMIRPRRKTSKREPIIIQRPLFFQYVAIRWFEAWYKLSHIRGVWQILTCSQTQEPLPVTRGQLRGMLELEKERSWDGQTIEVLSGPLAGRQGIYHGGKIELSLLGRDVWASVDPYHIKLVKEDSL